MVFFSSSVLIHDLLVCRLPTKWLNVIRLHDLFDISKRTKFSLFIYPSIQN